MATQRTFPPDARGLMGLAATDAIARAEAAGYSVRRLDVGDGMVLTADYRADRLTVVINRDGLVTDAYTG